MTASHDVTADVDTVFRLIYRSHSRIPDASERQELGDILRTARANNAAAGLTGALLLYNNWFAQVLEGPEDKVMTLFERIRADKRHDAVEIRQQSPAAPRLFTRWAMANVGEHNEPDIPLTATRDGVAEGAPFIATAAQDAVLNVLRDLTRGYGRGA